MRTLFHEEMATSRAPGMRHAGPRWRSLAAGLTLTFLAGCTSDHVVVEPSPAPPTGAGVAASSAPPCTGAAGKPVLRMLFADLSRGRPIDLTAYFVAPVDFVRWVDPDAYVTFLPGNDGTVNLDALQARLDEIERAHASMTVTGFTDGGYQGSPVNHDQGGWFSFTFRGRLDAHTVMKNGSGKGAIDCASKKIKVMVLG